MSLIPGDARSVLVSPDIIDGFASLAYRPDRSDHLQKEEGSQGRGGAHPLGVPPSRLGLLNSARPLSAWGNLRVIHRGDFYLPRSPSTESVESA